MRFFFIFLDISIDSDFYGFKLTNHASAHLEILSLSNCKTAAVSFGEFTAIQKIGMICEQVDLCLYLISFMYTRNLSLPKIEP